MTITLSLTQKKSADVVPIIAPTVFKMPLNIARLKDGESRANEYSKYFWNQLSYNGSELESKLNILVDKAEETKAIKLYCECGDTSSCHGRTLIEYLEWTLRKKGFDIKSK